MSILRFTRISDSATSVGNMPFTTVEALRWRARTLLVDRHICCLFSGSGWLARSIELQVWIDRWVSVRSNKSQDVLMVYYWRTKDWNGLHQSLAADGSQRSSTSEISSTCCSVAKCFNINLHASWKANYLQEFHKARRTIGWELGPPQDEGVSNFRQDSGQVLLSIGTAAKQHCTSTQVIIMIA